MKRFSPNWIQVFIRGLVLHGAIFKGNEKYVSTVVDDLENHLASLGLGLDESLKKRITKYTVGSAICSHIHGLVRQESPTDEELLRGAYMGVYTPIVDDIMDATGQSFTELQASEKVDAEHAIFRYILSKMDAWRKEREEYNRFFITAHDAQDWSMKQVGEERLSKEELEKITLEKGGTSNLWWRTILEHPLREGEEEVVYLIGAILQLSNDSFDVRKDYLNGHQTLVTQSMDFHEIENRYLAMTSRLKELYFQMDYSDKGLKQSFTTWSIIIVQGLIAIRKYKKLQGKAPKLEVEKYDRKTLITDMQSIPNMIRNGYYSNKW
ncbi:MAG: hypothetical protein HWD92_04440 [Flavobacteriia bacterium]|nr:hypothetical protein [Flavobacteriia bacterium]